MTEATVTTDDAIDALRKRAGVAAQLAPFEYSTLTELLSKAAERHPQHPALTSLGHTISYAELDAYATQFAIYLQQHTPLQPGDRIAIQLPNILQYPAVLFGAFKAGLVVVNVNPLYTDRELQHQFIDSGAKALVVVANVAHAVQDVLPDTNIETVIVTEVADLHPPLKRWALNLGARYIKKMVPAYQIEHSVSLRDCIRLGARGSLQPAGYAADDVVLLQYTGGTTGRAKGAMLTLSNLLANIAQARAMFRSFDNFPDGRQTVILPLPLYHVFAFNQCLLQFVLSNHLVLIANPRDIDSMVNAIRPWRYNGIYGLNTLFVALCNHEGFQDLDHSDLQITVSGGMALTENAAQTWETVTRCKVYEGYGLTETAPVVSINVQHARKLGSIGVTVPSTELKVIDAEGATLPCGVAGELCVRGPQVMKGYWRQPEKTAEVIDREGWFATGDIAVVDEDGYPRIVDRKKDMIIVSGFNVYPNEVENVLSSHDDVIECAVIGVPDPVAGESVRAYVVRRSEQLTTVILNDYAREHLAAYKVPDAVEFVDDLPKSNVGKILRRELRDRVIAANSE